MIRHLAAPIAGIVCGAAVVAAVEAVGHALFPFAPPRNAEPAALRAAMASAPLGALISVLVAWWLGAFAGAWTAVKIAPGRPTLHAAIVAGVLLLATVTNLIMLPHPWWMAVGGPAGIVVAVVLGCRLAQRRARVTSRAGGSPVRFPRGA